MIKNMKNFQKQNRKYQSSNKKKNQYLLSQKKIKKDVATLSLKKLN